MTAILSPVAEGGRPAAIGAPRLLAGLDQQVHLDAAAHLQVHGPMPGSDLRRLLAYADAVNLCGRGGAAFPFARKLQSLAGHRARVVVNGTEHEPGSHKDRTLLTRTPHLVLDGALAVARAVNARRVTVAVRDEVTAHTVRQAITQRPDASAVDVHIVGGGFVSGEARAVVRFLDGGPALPPGRRTPPTATGVLLSNAETFAQVAVLLRLGPQRYAATGTHDEPGTVLLSVGGAVGTPGVLEVPTGTPLGVVLAARHAAAVPQAVVVGGYHGGWHAPDPALRLSRSGLAAAGGTFGAGVLLVLDDATCPLGELARVTGWLAGESARQCGPCRFGLPALAQDVAALWHGHSAAATLGARHAQAVTGRGACAHPDGTVRFVRSGLHHLTGDVERHRHGGCGRPVLGQLPIGDHHDA